MWRYVIVIAVAFAAAAGAVTDCELKVASQALISEYSELAGDGMSNWLDQAQKIHARGRELEFRRAEREHRSVKYDRYFEISPLVRVAVSNNSVAAPALFTPAQLYPHLVKQEITALILYFAQRDQIDFMAQLALVDWIQNLPDRPVPELLDRVLAKLRSWIGPSSRVNPGVIVAAELGLETIFNAELARNINGRVSFPPESISLLAMFGSSDDMNLFHGLLSQSNDVETKLKAMDAVAIMAFRFMNAPLPTLRQLNVSHPTLELLGRG
jgi:hypothetical protein